MRNLKDSHYLISNTSYSTQDTVELIKAQTHRPHTHGQPVFKEGAKAIQRRKDSLFQKMVLKQLDSHIKKLQQTCTQTAPYTMNSKWTTDLNVKLVTMKLRI